MTIKKSVKIVQNTSPNVDAFIGGAPDAGSKPVGVIRGKKQIITIGFAPEALERIDAAAAKVGISRAAWINLACAKLAAAEYRG